jgi:hypothetical protein
MGEYIIMIGIDANGNHIPVLVNANGLLLIAN